MKPKMYVVLGLCLMMVASLFLCSASNSPKTMPGEPQDSHSVNEAFMHALLYAEQHYSLPGLTRLEWEASVDNHPDLPYATHHVFVNQPETIAELQAHFAINPAHSGFVTDQLTLIVHAPDDHGHVVEGHGYNHEIARYLPRDQEDQVMKKAIAMIQKLGDNFHYMGPDDLTRFWRDEYEVHKELGKAFKKPS